MNEDIYKFRGKGFALPPVEKGIPLPPARQPGVRINKPKRRPSRYEAFLRALQPGDSFLVDYATSRTITNHARRLGIDFRCKHLSGGRVRMWPLFTVSVPSVSSVVNPQLK